MKNFLFAVAVLATALPAIAQTNVSVQIGQPNFYGRIDLGDFRQPPLVYGQPIIIDQRANYAPEPLYLRVPPGHRNKWSKHCSRYNACGRPVYFVRDEWYSNTYAPRYRETHGERQGGDHGRVRQVVRAQAHEGGRDHERHDQQQGHGGHGEHGGQDKHDKRDKHDGGGHGNGHGNGKH